VKAGVPDIIAVHEGRRYPIEIKRGRAQLAAIAALERAGAHTAICYGQDRALATLETWGLLRGRVELMRHR
jgi:RecB family endonuclease NucS